MSRRIRSAWGHPPTCGLLTVIAAITLLACGRDAEPAATEPPRVAAAVGIAISPPSLSMLVPDERGLTARAYDAHGRTVAASIAWSSANANVATVGATDGRVRAISAGSTTVTATSGTLSATATVSVQDVPVAAFMSISPSAFTLIAGDFERLTVSAWDSAGQARSVSVEWSSADPAVATIGNADGIVTAISLGTTTLTAAAGALRATASVVVLSTAGALSGSFAFTRGTSTSGDITFDVLTLSAADRTPRSLPRPAQFASILAPAWSPDGTLLAVEVISEYFPYDWHDYNSDLYVLNAAHPADAPWRALTTNGLSRSPSWSPDGKRIAYLQQTALWAYSNDIYIIDATGGVPVRLTRTSGEYGAPRWSPDGTRLAFSSAEGEGSEIFIVNADGSGLTNVTRSSAFDYEPSWSPDGAQLAFASSRDNSRSKYSLDVFIVDVDGSNVRRLTSSGGRAPAWSPDGRQIIFSSSAALQVMNADGSSLVRLIRTPLNSWDDAPVWRR